MNQNQIVKKFDELAFFNELSNKEKETLASLENHILQVEPFVNILKEDGALSIFARVVAAIQSIFSAVFVGLFALAMRWRFRRG